MSKNNWRAVQKNKKEKEGTLANRLPTVRVCVLDQQWSPIMACWRAAFTMAIDLSFGEKFAGRRRGVIGNCKVTAHFRITYRIALPMVGTGYDNPPNKKQISDWEVLVIM